jgi:hypothetical protein
VSTRQLLAAVSTASAFAALICGDSFFSKKETVKTVSAFFDSLATSLKRGVNEIL